MADATTLTGAEASATLSADAPSKTELLTLDASATAKLDVIALDPPGGDNLGCAACTSCTGCSNCTRCDGCVSCTDCIDCINCVKCTACFDCRFCAGITNGQGLRYVAFGVQLSPAEYAAVATKLLGGT